MRVVAGLLEQRSLFHTEFVLFVDHDQTEFVKFQLRSDDGMRADDDVDFSSGDFGG